MDKTSRKILNYLIDQNQGCDFICNFNNALDSLSKEIKLNSEDIRAAVRYLNRLVYFFLPSCYNGMIGLPSEI